MTSEGTSSGPTRAVSPRQSSGPSSGRHELASETEIPVNGCHVSCTDLRTGDLGDHCRRATQRIQEESVWSVTAINATEGERSSGQSANRDLGARRRVHY